VAAGQRDAAAAYAAGGLPGISSLAQWRRPETQAMADDVSLLIIERTGDSDEN
jgi:hypothetical protein